MAKNLRRAIAHETLEICKRGTYVFGVDPEQTVDIQDLIERARLESFEVIGGDAIPRRHPAAGWPARAGSSSVAEGTGGDGDVFDAEGKSLVVGPRASLAEPLEGSDVDGRFLRSSPGSGSSSLPHFVVSHQTSLEALYALAADRQLDTVMLLNFASAKNPGGGFLGGAQAQEESLARSSGLYTCLTCFQDRLYARNKADPRGCLYSDDMIFSPLVPFFREDDGTLLPRPVLCSVVTAPAPNAGAVKADVKHLLIPTLRSRIRRMLQLAAAQDLNILILGAWGCGVFRNDPRIVAQHFKELLTSSEFSQLFSEVHFPIPDRAMMKTFADVLGVDTAGNHCSEHVDGDLAVSVVITSFGHQSGRGVPQADLIYDARHIRNPEGGPKTQFSGLDARLRKEVMACDGASELLDRMCTGVRACADKGASSICVAVGCERGKHRSVSLAVELGAALQRRGCAAGRRFKVVVQHREEDMWQGRHGRHDGGRQERGGGKASRKQGRAIRDAEEIEAEGGLADMALDLD